MHRIGEFLKQGRHCAVGPHIDEGILQERSGWRSGGRYVHVRRNAVRYRELASERSVAVGTRNPRTSTLELLAESEQCEARASASRIGLQ